MILGIDPGPTQSALVLWDGKRILESEILSNIDVAQKLTNRWTPHVVVAVEHLQCMGMAVGASVFETAYWVGEYRALVRLIGLPFVRVMRSEVKIHHCNSMRAKDSNIRQALIDRFGAPGTKKAQGLTYGLKGDIWSAFAIAVMVYDKQTATVSCVCG